MTSKYIITIILLILLTDNVLANDKGKNLKEKSEVSFKKKSNITTKKDDIDNEITNARMRAQSGSKSKLSLSVNMGYSGGSISSPFGKNRPDIYGNPENETLTSIGGSISGRYRFDKYNSLSLGAGISYLAPFRSDNNPNRNQFNIDNPGFTYSRVKKIWKLQTTSSVKYVVGTSESFKDAKLDGYLSLQQNFLKQFKKISLTAGISIAFTTYRYGDNAKKLDSRTSYDLGFYPYLEYELSDKYSIRTVLGFFNYEHRREDSSKNIFTMHTSPSYQSIGLGIAATRDIYIYPNIQFLPKNLTADKTNVAVSIDLNI